MAVVDTLNQELAELQEAFKQGQEYARILRGWIKLENGDLRVDPTPEQRQALRAKALAAKADFKTDVAAI